MLKGLQSRAAQWHFYERPSLYPLNTDHIPAIHTATCEDNQGYTKLGEMCECFQQIDNGWEGEWEGVGSVREMYICHSYQKIALIFTLNFLLFTWSLCRCFESLQTKSL